MFTKKKVLALLVIMALGVVGVGQLMADWGDSFKLTFTPTGTRGVIITTDTVALTPALGGSAITGAIPVLSTGTVGNIEYTIAGGLSGGAAFSPDATLTADELLLQAMFNSTAPGAFGDEDIVTETPVDAGNKDLDAATGSYEGNVEVDDMDLLTSWDLFCQVTLPSAVNYTGAQEITVTVTAEVAD